MPLAGYRDLHVWRRARSLAIDVFRVTSGSSFRREFGLRDQMRRAAVSIPSNIAEGHDRGSHRDSVRFLFYARGSLAELATQADIADAVGFLEPGVCRRWLDECSELARMLAALI